ncbi:MAG: class I SAM-dependent methyltransferase [Candidatus Bathyarchaeia archaeon]
MNILRGAWRVKARIKKLYDSSRYCYLELYRGKQIAKYDRIIDSIRNLRFKVILDAGCGPGFYVEKLSKIADLYIGLDICRGMLDIAKDMHKHISNVEFIVGDADYPPFRDGSFDIVLAVTLLQNQPDPRLTISKLAKLVKDDGILATTFLKKMFNLKDVLRIMESSTNLTPIYIDDSTEDYIVVCKVGDMESKQGDRKVDVPSISWMR